LISRGSVAGGGEDSEATRSVKGLLRVDRCAYLLTVVLLTGD